MELGIVLVGVVYGLLWIGCLAVALFVWQELSCPWWCCRKYTALEKYVLSFFIWDLPGPAVVAMGPVFALIWFLWDRISHSSRGYMYNDWREQ
jgi:hypothetical protein